MGLLNALTSAPGLRQFAPAASYELPDDYRAYEPELDLPWGEPETEPAEAESEDQPAPSTLFLVCRQNGMTSRERAHIRRAHSFERRQSRA